MKYKYYFDAIQCNRWYSNFMRSCDLGVDEVGINIVISFKTDTEPTKDNIKLIEDLLNSTKNEKSLDSYYVNVKFKKAEVVIEGVNDF